MALVHLGLVVVLFAVLQGKGETGSVDTSEYKTKI